MQTILLAGFVPVPPSLATGTTDPWGVVLVVGTILAVAVAVTLALVYFNKPAPKRAEKAEPVEHLRKAA